MYPPNSNTALAKIGVFLCAFFLISCSNDQDTKPQGDPSISEIEENKPEPFDPSIPRTVATTDEPITLPAPANGIAFWSHPDVPFQGLVIAATPKGVFAHTLEGDEQSEGQTGDAASINAKGAALAYFPKNDKSKNAKATAVFSTFDENNQAFRFFTIDNALREFSEDILSIPYSDNFTQFCLSSNPVNYGIDIYIIDHDKLTIHTLAQLPDGGFDLGEKEVRQILDLQSCAVAPATKNRSAQTVYGITKTGNIVRLPSGDTVAKTEIMNGHLAIFSSKKDSENPISGSTIVNQFFVLDEESAKIHILSSDSGALLGIISLEDYNEIKGVTGASSIAAGSGNFGGLYRAGALALASSTDNDEPAIRLTPFLAIARTLNLEVNTPVSLRSIAEQSGEGLKTIKPTLDISIGKIGSTPQPD